MYTLQLVLAGLVAVVHAQFGAYPNPNGGGIKLIGSSFGLLGQNATFDYIIVGGGTAGLTVANRLAAQPGVSVAVIEGGSFYEISNGNLSQVPAFDFYHTTADPKDQQPLIEWGFVTVPQPQLQNRILHYTQGKTFGGGSARNYLAYQRATVGAYQAWANQVDDQSYTYSNLLPYLQKSVAFTPPNYAKRETGGTVLYNSSGFSSSGGPLHVSYANYWAPIATYLQSAFAKLGLAAIEGFNTGSLIGYAEFTSCIDPASETRSSSETAFLQQSIYETYIQVYQQTIAQRILFNANKKAIGVNVTTAGVSYILSANKEVILSAGAFRSPQLLMLSGIGPTAELSKFNIPVISALAGVGQNLWDQPYFGTTYQVNVTTQSALANATYFEQATSDYLTQQKGPLTLPGGSIAAFEKVPAALRANMSASTISELNNFPSDWPDLELLPLGAAGGPTTAPGNYIAMNIAVLSTTSRGTVTLASTDASVNPLISPNWLVTTADQQVAVAGLRRAREVAQATGATIGAEVYPGPAVQTDAQILSYIQSVLAPIHHASCTCAMGKAGDPNAVVDTRGRVFGVTGLRVIDVSALPFLPPGHPQSEVYMLAEKLVADIISDDGLA